MMQLYKNIYFRDCPETASGRSSLTLAFGKNDREIHEAVRHLSSDAVRNALGFDSYTALQNAARACERSLNSFCLSILRRRLEANRNPDTAWLTGLNAVTPLTFDPIQATFDGGRHEPLHDWYPWLEGYSPAFVEAIIGTHCPNAKCVFDPFSGTGTTPLTASRLGKRALFSEINPVLQLLTASKVVALQLNDRARAELSDELEALVDTLDDKIEASPQDQQLRAAYHGAFGDSEFFDDDVLADILRCRMLIDDFNCTAPTMAQFLTIAVMRALIPASRLIRRGDLRFKTRDELARGQSGLRNEIRGALAVLVRDIRELSSIDQAPILLLENAKNLDRVPPQQIDAVITSPPYLNGTNYFRNTKIELWFLRCLKERRDLTRFRYSSMTVGINDVTVAKPIGAMPASAADVYKLLEANAYDARIPRMVACFASEMHAMLRTLSMHIGRDATVAIDIGDSAYAGVHVPTDKFIIESMDTAGLDLTEERMLRQRQSRSQVKLTQKLLVFKPKQPRELQIKRSRTKPKTSWSTAWEDFKQTLPHRQGDFAKRNWGHPRHSICSYQGKMKPSLASHLVRSFAAPGSRMLDPFSGAGTIPFEAALHGVECWGFDISPAALHITEAKIGPSTLSECKEAVNRLEATLQGGKITSGERSLARSIRFNGELSSYFHKRTFDEVLLARRHFLDCPPNSASESLVLACLLHILHGNRPYALSRHSHPITPFAPSGGTEYRALIPRLLKKIERTLSLPLPSGFTCGHSIYQDATEWWPRHVENLDAVITSPPFFDSTRFYLGNWMRLWFCGWEASDFRRRPPAFVDERQKVGFDVYQPVLRQCRERLKSGGVAVFHLGSSRKCDMAKELAGIAKTWFQVADIFTESVSHCESHGIRDKGSVANHQYLVLQ